MTVQSPKNKKKKAGDGGYGKLGQELNTASNLSHSLGWDTPSDKLDNTVPTDYQNAINSLTAATDPNSSAFVGRRSDELKSILNKMSGGLAGLNADENTALREQAQREIRRNYETAARDLAVQASRFGVRGASATSQMQNLARQTGQDISNEEQDLLVKNIDIQDKRRNDYENAIRGIENDEFGRVRDTRTDLIGALDKRNDYVTGINKTNLDLSNKDKVAKILGTTGLMGIVDSRRQGNRQFRLAKEGMSHGYGVSSGGSGGGVNQELINAISKINDQQFGSDSSNI